MRDPGARHDDARAAARAVVRDGVVVARTRRRRARARTASGCRRELMALLDEARRRARTTSIASRSRSGPDRSPGCASASRRSRGSRWRSGKLRRRRLGARSAGAAPARDAAARADRRVDRRASRRGVRGAVRRRRTRRSLEPAVVAAAGGDARRVARGARRARRASVRRRRRRAAIADVIRAAARRRRASIDDAAAARRRRSAQIAAARAATAPCRRTRSSRSTSGGRTPSSRATARHGRRADVRVERARSRRLGATTTRRDRRARGGVVHQPLVARDARLGAAATPTSRASTCCATTTGPVVGVLRLLARLRRAAHQHAGGRAGSRGGRGWRPRCCGTSGRSGARRARRGDARSARVEHGRPAAVRTARVSASPRMRPQLLHAARGRRPDSVARRLASVRHLEGQPACGTLPYECPRVRSSHQGGGNADRLRRAEAAVAAERRRVPPTRHPAPRPRRTDPQPHRPATTSPNPNNSKKSP